MADRYVRSTDGSNADNGTTWALAKADGAGIAAIDTAGDRLFFSHVHAEAPSTAQTWALAGTAASPVRLLCGNDGAAPPTALATTATFTSSLATGSAYSITGNAYVYGFKFTWLVIFSLGSASGDEQQTFDNCQFIFAGGGSSCNIVDTASTGRKLFQFRDCQFKFDAAGEFMAISSSWYFRGGSIQAGTTTPTSGMFKFGTGGRGSLLVVENFDFSNCSSSLVLIDITSSSTASRAMFRNCKMPASWNVANLGSVAIPGNGVRYEMWNCDNGSTNWKLYIEEFSGTIEADTGTFRSGGYSDGTTPLSWSHLCKTNCQFPSNTLTSPEIVAWNDSTGSPLTATIEIISSATVTDAQAWMELQYPGTSGQSIYSTISDAAANILATPANQTSSSATWTSAGVGTVKQKLEVTFTPQQKGPVYGRVVICDATGAIVVYVDPKMTIA